MPKFIDLGRKREQPTATLEGSVKQSRIDYPSLSLVGDQIPDELKDAKNDSQCRAEVVLRKIGDSINTYEKGEPRRIEIEVQKLGYIGKAGKKTKEEYLNSSPEEQEKYDKESTGIEEEKEE